MPTINTYYLRAAVRMVEDKTDFFDNGTKEAPILRKLYNTIKHKFSLTDNQVGLNVIEGNVGYRFDVLGYGPLKKDIMCLIYYFPNEKGLDIYDHTTMGSGMPLIAFRNKKCALKNYSALLDFLKLDLLFNPLVSVI